MLTISSEKALSQLVSLNCQRITFRFYHFDTALLDRGVCNRKYLAKLIGCRTSSIIEFKFVLNRLSLNKEEKIIILHKQKMMLFSRNCLLFLAGFVYYEYLDTSHEYYFFPEERGAILVKFSHSAIVMLSS